MDDEIVHMRAARASDRVHDGCATPDLVEAIAWTHQSPAGFSRRHRAEEHFSTSIGVGDHVARVVLERCRAAAGRRDLFPGSWMSVRATACSLRQLLKLGFPARNSSWGGRPSGASGPAGALDQGVAPACVPRFAGLLFAHEFWMIAAEYVVDGRLQRADLTLGEPAAPDDLQWLHKWTGGETGLVGRSRDEAWAHLVGSVEVGRRLRWIFARGTGGSPGRTQVVAGSRWEHRHLRWRGVAIVPGPDRWPCHPATGVLAGRPAADVQEVRNSRLCAIAAALGHSTG